MDKEKKQKLQQKYLEMQFINQQIIQVQKQLEMLANQMQEIHITKESLDEIAGINPGTEILVPLASGIFIKAQINDNKEAIVNVGAGTAVKKTIPETKELIGSQYAEIESFRKELESQLQQLLAKAKHFEKEISELAE